MQTQRAPVDAPAVAAPDLVPPLPAGVANHREDPLFRAHPLRRTYLSSHGLTLPVEFHVYCSDTRTIAGTADLGEVERYLDGTELAAVRTERGQALAALVMCDYQDTSLGAYQVGFVMLMAARGQRQVVRWRDGFSALLPMLDPAGTIFVFGSYALTRNAAALDLGRDHMGIAKYEADLLVGARSRDRATTVLRDERGHEVLRVEARDAGAADGPGALWSLLRNLGVVATTRLVAGGRAVRTYRCVGHEPGGAVAPGSFTSHMKLLAASRPWTSDDVLQIESGSPLTDLLLKLRFTPAVYGRDRRMMTATVPGE